MKAVYCGKCKAQVDNDEIALNIKLFGKQISNVQCYHCLSKSLYCNVSELQEKVDFYKSMGCTLFNINYIDMRERVGR
jgi:hypothetical protein